MEWLNYHHLLYFWVVAREGSVKRASEILLLAQPTLSAQIRKLEDALDEKLFMREGRGLKLTETGHVVYEYADEIFRTGRELLDTLRGRPSTRPARLFVGLADVVPKLVAYRILDTALTMPEPVRLVVHEGKTEDLIAGLATERFDMLLTDTPLGPQSRVKAFNHPLGSCAVGFFASREIVDASEGEFPGNLEGMPFVAPALSTAIRHDLDRWFEERAIRPRIVAEIEDSALIKVFGGHGRGMFAAPMTVAEELCRQNRVELLGVADEVRAHFYAITVERRIVHPAVAIIAATARDSVFDPPLTRSRRPAARRSRPARPAASRRPRP